jgi:hypothetical protein
MIQRNARGMMHCVKETLTLHHHGEDSLVNRTNRDNSNSGIAGLSRDKVLTRRRQKRISRNSLRNKVNSLESKQKKLIKKWGKRMQARDHLRDSLEEKDLEFLKTSLS